MSTLNNQHIELPKTVRARKKFLKGPLKEPFTISSFFLIFFFCFLSFGSKTLTPPPSCHLKNYEDYVFNYDKAFEFYEVYKKGCDLKRAQFNNKNFESSFFIMAQLEGAHLKNANLSFSNLNFSNFQKANLQFAKLRSSLLFSVNFKEAVLFKAFLEKSFLFKASLEGAQVSKASLKNAFLHKSYLKKAHFEEADLSLTQITFAFLFETNFFKARLLEADFTGSKIKASDFRGSDLRGAYFLNLESLDEMTDFSCAVYDITTTFSPLFTQKQKESMIQVPTTITNKALQSLINDCLKLSL